MSTEPENIHVEAVLDELVRQFSEPVACFRELVQNALDAGTPQIDIDFEWREPDGDDSPGTMVVDVRDYGEGMDRSLIENRLTKLFSSGKTGDYTKIGRFGIGFVSVFALEPFCVCVDTGRSGEYWRVLFDGRQSFELISLDHPVEGTRVRIYKHLGRDDYEQLRREARQAVIGWCKHASSPILFDGTDVRRPFEIDAICAVRHREEGTRMVVGLTEEATPPCGYYNRGLTLHEDEESPWPHVAFKIDSRYLEHTLTRDEILDNADFRKATTLLESHLHDTLPQTLLDELETTARQADAVGRHDSLCTAWQLFLQHYDVDDGWRGRRIIPRVGGEPISIDACQRAARRGKLVATPYAHRPSRFADEYTFVDARTERRGLLGLLDALLDEAIIPFDERFTRFEPADLNDESERRLETQTAELLERVGIAVSTIDFVRFERPTTLAHPVGATAPPGPSLVASDEAITDPEQLQDALVVVNCEYPAVRAALAVARRQPAWAAYTLAVNLLAGRVDSVDRTQLISATLDARSQQREALDE